MPVEEREQQRGDVVPVAVGVHQQEHLPVAQPGRIEVLAHPAPERARDVGELLVAGDLFAGRLLRVEHLAAQREDRLGAPVAALLGGATCRVTLDDEQLAVRRAGRRAVGELPGEVEPVRHRALPGHRLGGRARGLAGPGGEDDPRHHRLGHRLVVVEPLLQRRANHAVHLGGGLGVVQPVLGLSLELRVRHVGGEDGRHALADVLRGQAHALRGEAVRLDVVAHGLHHARAQARFMGAAR